MGLHLAHSQTNCQATIEYMSDPKNKQKAVKLCKTLIWNKWFATLQLVIDISVVNSSRERTLSAKSLVLKYEAVIYLTALKSGKSFWRNISYVRSRERTLEHNVPIDCVIVLRTNIKPTGEKRWIDTNLGDQPCALCQQQRYKTKQHQL